MWKISTRLDRTIGYAEDEEKTLNKEYTKSYYDELDHVIGYAMNDMKTEKQFYVTGINCMAETAYQEMMITKQQFNKIGGILGFHAYQSFKGHEVSPEIAHEIGVKLAEELWGDRFEVIVTTHLNTDNYHNHFVLNSVSYVDGKKFYANRSTYGEFRVTSDNLCKEYGISVLESKACKKSKIFYEKYYYNSLKNSNYYITAKENIDRAIEQAYSYSDFENLLKAMNYKLIYRNNVLSIRRYPYKKNIRISRIFGLDYSREMIEKRIKETEVIRLPFIEEYGIEKRKIYKQQYHKEKSHGIKALYLYYCYLLNIFPNKNYKKKVPASIRIDVYNLEKINKETEFLSDNNINTYNDFIKFRDVINNQYNNNLDYRCSLWNKVRVIKDKKKKENLLSEIDDLTGEIDQLSMKLDICRHIEERAPKMAENIEEYEKREERIK